MKAWFLLFRPWSYTATLVPFLVAAAFGAHALDARWGRWAVGLAAGFLFQATVNLLNTWGDERSGVDDVPGAIRTTPQIHDGVISMRAVLAAALACAFLAGAIGVSLCFLGTGGARRIDWALLAAGFVGFLGATNYSTGFRFKYRGLGVPFVAFLMGPLEIFVALALLFPEGVRVCWNSGVFTNALLGGLVIALPVASLVCVIMHGNDMRDIPTDRAAGIRTTASFLGPRGALRLYRFCHLLPYAAVTAVFAGPLVSCGVFTPWLLLPFLAFPLTRRTLASASAVYAESPGNPPWRGLERASGKIHLVFGTLYALALFLSGVAR